MTGIWFVRASEHLQLALSVESFRRVYPGARVLLFCDAKVPMLDELREGIEPDGYQLITLTPEGDNSYGATVNMVDLFSKLGRHEVGPVIVSDCNFIHLEDTWVDVESDYSFVGFAPPTMGRVSLGPTFYIGPKLQELFDALTDEEIESHDTSLGWQTVFYRLAMENYLDHQLYGWNLLADITDTNEFSTVPEGAVEDHHMGATVNCSEDMVTRAMGCVLDTYCKVLV